MTIALPRGRHIVEFLASRPEFVGIGKATAKRLWDRFGEELYAILGDGAHARLSEVLHESHAKILADAWRNEQAIADCVVFFDKNGIDPKVAHKAVEFGVKGGPGDQGQSLSVADGLPMGSSGSHGACSRHC